MSVNTAERGFFFVRHGQTDANRDGIRSGGDCDTSLTELGRGQARIAADTLHSTGVKPSMIVTAPLSRTLETAELMKDRLGLKIQVESGLLERQLGEWNGLSVVATQPSLTAGETPPGGESNVEFQSRILSAFRRLTPLYPGWPLIVSSRGVARILLEHAGHENSAPLENGAILRVFLADTGNRHDFEVVAIHHIHPRIATA